MAVNFTRVGAEVQVNATALENDEFDPDVVALTDGRFAVVNTREVSPGDIDVNLQFVNANGTLSGVRLLVDNDLGFQSQAAVASRLGGGAVVVWKDEDGKDAFNNPLTDAIQLRVVSANGTMSAPLTVSDIETNRDPDAAMLSNGQVVIVWQTDLPGDSDIGLRVLNAAGNGFTGPIMAIDVIPSLDSVAPAIAASGNNALIAYRDAVGDDIRVKLFNGAAGTLNSDGTVAGKLVASTGELDNPDVAALAGGRYVVVWENKTNDNVEGRFVDAGGNPIGATFTIANNAGDNLDPRVAALPDGGFIVTWETTGGVIAPENGGDFAVLARRFDPTGAAAGDLFLVNTGDPSTNQFDPAVAVNRSTGQAFMAWTDNHAFTGTGQDNDPPGVRGRAFKATIDVVNGTAGGDVISTYGLGETINGLGGGDAIDGRGGNDTINGGLGSDNLTGGPGGDLFLFNAKLSNLTNIDVIFDFSPLDDTIVLDNAIFKKLKKEGALKGKYFFEGKKAHDGNDVIVYNDRNGDLSYDKNGKKKGGTILFAELEGSPNDVSAADFVVI
jgi:Ca2+-binding RTX toxin-like protein